MRLEQSSLFRRLMLGFAAVLAGVALLGLFNVFTDAKSSQRSHTASENKARAKEIFLTVSSVAPEQIPATARAIESVRRELFKEMKYGSQVRVRIWQADKLIYNSAPELPDVLPIDPEHAGQTGNRWVRWLERDAQRAVVVERSHEIDDEWIFSGAGARLLLMPSLFNLMILLLPAWVIVTVGLRPLKEVADAIEQRSDADLTPLPDSRYRELSPLIRSINQLMRRLGERIEREHDFLTEAAHELKTPLAAIQINAHLVASRSAAGNLEGSREASTELRDSVARATHAVHQLLALERMRSDSSSRQLPEVELGAFVRERLAAAAPLAIQRAIEIELRTAVACPMRVEVESMGALVDNLISNAIKYSPDGGRITVHISSSGDQVRLEITDQGPGIDPVHLPNVFERFYRVPGQDQPGSGLGLAIAQRAAARNAGVIRLENVEPPPGLRATVTFTRN